MMHIFIVDLCIYADYVSQKFLMKLCRTPNKSGSQPFETDLQEKIQHLLLSLCETLKRNLEEKYR
jgi:hypothetical protein